MASHILLLEDDADIRIGMEQYFKREGFSVCSHDLAKEAMDYLNKSVSGAAPRVDVAILDLTLPDYDGLEVLRAIRREPALKFTPVIIVTARGEEIDRVLGLELGADDYLSKPFSTRELVARVRAILRRASFLTEALETAPANTLTFGPILVDLDGYAARVDGHLIDLTRKEFELLAYLMKNPRRVLGREKILQQVWGLDYLGESRTIDAHVRRLRYKLGDAADLIETVVGVGYRLGNPDM
ncbi:MAG: response regulator transcription factor [Holophagales bacterium]|jgi:DNA-binding response OmpR family regulator|nr:response regulator transcription factor [Holophagales bacterium]